LNNITFPPEERSHTLGIISNIIDPHSLYIEDIEVIYSVDWCDGKKGKYLLHEIEQFKDFLNTYHLVSKRT
jgi:hypothetical protein